MALVPLLLSLLGIVSAQYFEPQQYYQPQGFDQSLSYSGSGGSGSGSGSGSTVPSVPSYGGGSPSSGSGSVPSGGGSVPSYGGDAPGSGSGSGSVPVGGSPSGGYDGGSGDPSVGSGSSPVGGIPGIGGGSGGVPGIGGGSGGIPGIGGGSGGIPTVPSTGGGTSPSPSGCSCDFWAAHVNSWPDPLQLLSTVSAIFGGLASNIFGPSTTLYSALHDNRPAPYSQLLRQGTAALLNSYANSHFFYSPQAVRTHFNAALASPHAAAVQAQKFANANRGYGTNTVCT